MDFVDYEMIFAYAIFCVTLLSAIVFSVVPIFKNFKKAIPVLLGIVGAVAFYLICYALANSEPLTITTGTGIETTSGGVMRFVEANIFMAYSAFAIALLALAYSSVSSYFK